jgi:multiple sugar transport system substrate-binding protein
MDNPNSIGKPTIALVVAVAAVVIIGMLVISDDAGPDPEPTPASPSPTQREVVEFGAWGTETELDAFRSVVETYNDEAEVVEAELLTWPDADAMLADIRSGEATPDLYLLPRRNLAETIAEGRNRPVLDLLDARGVSLGDDYSRTAVTAFTADDAMQCMPYTSSPMVIYYNTDLIDFEAMAEQGLPVPREEDGRWSLDAFRAAAEVATRPRQRTRGFYIEPTLEALAPFIYSGGGEVFDDAVDPTSLALGEEGSVNAMTRTLEVLRDSKLTLDEDQVQRRSAVDRFKAGRLGMIAGYRDLTPQLRGSDVNFDVLPMPRLDAAATVGALNGLCIAEGAQPQVERAADFLVHAVSDESMSMVAAAGTVVPANLPVAFGNEFLQPARQPQRALVFTVNQRAIRLWPLIDSGGELEELAAPGLTTLLTAPVLTQEEIDRILDDIDEASRPVLDPDYEEPEDSEDSGDSAGSGGSGAPSSPDASGDAAAS